MVQQWKVNLLVCSLGSITTVIGFSVIMPFLPDIIRSYGLTNVTTISHISGLAYSASFLTAGVLAPVWGWLSDRYGRKSMLIRSSLGLVIALILLIFTRNSLELVLCRLATGMLGGYASSATAMIAIQTPKEKSGWALGILSSSVMFGNVMGPLLGGVLSGWFGYKITLVFCAAIICITFITTAVFVKEIRVSSQNNPISTKDIPANYSRKTIYGLFALTIILSLSILSVEPILPFLVAELGSPIAVVAMSGIIFSLGSLGAVISAPQLGKLADKFSNSTIITICLISAAVCLFFQAWVNNVYELGILRFATGLCLGGLLPCVVAELKNRAPSTKIGQVTSINVSCQYLGQVVGPILGSIISGLGGYASVFIVTSIIALGGVVILKFCVRSTISI